MSTGGLERSKVEPGAVSQEASRGDCVDKWADPPPECGSFKSRLWQPSEYPPGHQPDFPAPAFPIWLQPDLAAPRLPSPTQTGHFPDGSQSWLHRPHLCLSCSFCLAPLPASSSRHDPGRPRPCANPTPPPIAHAWRSWSCPPERLRSPLLTRCGPPQWNMAGEPDTPEEHGP